MNSIDKENYHYISVVSNRGSSFLASGFDGSLQFDCMLSSKQYLDGLHKSYFVLNATVNKALVTTNDNATTIIYDAANSMGISQNPASALFSSCESSINGVFAQRVEDFGVHSMVNKLLNESLENQYESFSPMFLYNGDFKPIVKRNTDGTLSIVPVPDCIESQNNINRNCIKNNTVETNVVPFIPLEVAVATGFQIQIIIPYPMIEPTGPEDETFLAGNTQITTIFQVRQNYTSYLFQGLSVLPSDVVVNNFSWQIPVYVDKIPTGMPIERKYIETNTQRKVHNNTQYTYSLSAATKKIVICFTNSFDKENEIYSIDGATQNVVGFKNSMIPVNAGLLTLSINFNGNVYPFGGYDFSIGSVSNSYSRAYQDYLDFSGSLDAGEHNLIKDFKTFMMHPVFIFNVKSSLNSVGSAMLTVNITQEVPLPTPSPYDICLTSIHYKQLNIQYSDQGVPLPPPDGTKFAVI